MRVEKRGKGRAVKIPAEIARSLDLKEGDQVTIDVTGERVSEVSLNRDHDRALETLRKLRRPFPPGFKFDRDEANAR